MGTVSRANFLTMSERGVVKWVKQNHIAIVYTSKSLSNMNMNLLDVINMDGEFDVKVAESNMRYYEQKLDMLETEYKLNRYQHTLELKRGTITAPPEIALLRNLIEQHEYAIERHYEQLQEDEYMEYLRGDVDIDVDDEPVDNNNDDDEPVDNNNDDSNELIGAMFSS